MRIAHFFRADANLGISRAVSSLVSIPLLKFYKTNHLLVYAEKKKFVGTEFNLLISENVQEK